MTTKQTPPETKPYQDSRICLDQPKPMKKDNILWMLFDRSWAAHLINKGERL